MPLVQETEVQSQVKLNQKLKNDTWCLLVGIKGKWSIPGKGIVLYQTPWCSSYWKGTFDYGHLTYICMKVNIDKIQWYLFIVYFSFASVISVRIHRYVNYFDIQVLMMITETEMLTSTLHHNIFTYLDYAFFLLPYIYIYIYTHTHM